MALTPLTNSVMGSRSCLSSTETIPTGGSTRYLLLLSPSFTSADSLTDKEGNLRKNSW